MSEIDAGALARVNAVPAHPFERQRGSVMPSGARHPYLTPNLVKPVNPPLSLQPSHSLDEIISRKCLVGAPQFVTIDQD